MSTKTAKTKQKTAGEKQPYHHGDLRTALMQAALLLIDRHGIKGFSLKDAAADAGVSTAAPYRHFADKDALLRAIQSEGFALFDASLAAAYESATGAQAKIVELGVAYVRFAFEHPAHFRVMFGWRGGEQSEPGAGGASGFLLLVEAVAALHPHAPAETRNDLVLVCWSLVHGFAILQLEGAFGDTLRIGDPGGRLRRALTVLTKKTAEQGPGDAL
jgi:AcrR family transcriptional regulator